MATRAQVKAKMFDILSAHGGEMRSDGLRRQVLDELDATMRSTEDVLIGELREKKPFEVATNAKGFRVVRLRSSARTRA